MKIYNYAPCRFIGADNTVKAACICSMMNSNDTKLIFVLFSSLCSVVICPFKKLCMFTNVVVAVMAGDNDYCDELTDVNDGKSAEW